MATSGSVHTNTYGGRTITLTVEEISTSIDTNTSTVQWTLTSGTSSTYHSVYEITAWVNGTASTNKVYGPKTADWSSRAFPCKNGSTSGTLTIPHNADGTASAVPFRLRGSVYNNNPQNYDGSIDLTTIPRASSFTLSKTSGGTATTSFTLGDNIYVNITRASNNFNHKVYFVVGSSGNQVLSNNATTSANTSLATSLAQYIPATSGTATMYVKTYNGSTSDEANLVGTKTLTFTINVPSSVKPSISSVTKSDTANLLASYGAYVQSKSSLRVQTSATASYSTITTYTVKLKNSSNVVLATATGSDVTFSNINNAGTITVEVTVTDGRNRTATNTSTITVASYTNPSISKLKAERLNNDDTVTLDFSASINNVNSANVNSKTFKLYKKKTSDISWTLLETDTSSYTYSNNAYTTTCDGNYAWDFKLEAIDSFTTSTYTSSVGTAFELINWGADGTSIAFGKVAETSNMFECNLNANFKGDLKQNGTAVATTNQIPTVNNATLTIQKNGSTVNTFTANASSNVTANITVPTNTNQLTNGAGFITSSSLPSATTGSVTCTKSSGNSAIQTATYYQYGKVITIFIKLKTSGNTSIGSNIWSGKISNVTLPKTRVTGAGYYASGIAMAGIYGTSEGSDSGRMDIRALGASFANNQEIYFSITYVTNN